MVVVPLMGSAWLDLTHDVDFSVEIPPLHNALHIEVHLSLSLLTPKRKFWTIIGLLRHWVAQRYLGIIHCEGMWLVFLHVFDVFRCS